VGTVQILDIAYVDNGPGSDESSCEDSETPVGQTVKHTPRTKSNRAAANLALTTVPNEQLAGGILLQSAGATPFFREPN